MLAFLVVQEEGDTSVNSSDWPGGRRIRVEAAAGDFERFLMTGKGVSVIAILAWIHQHCLSGEGSPV